MNYWARLAIIAGVMMTGLAGSTAYSADQPSYVNGVSKVPQREPVKYEIAFVARFDNRIVVDSGVPGPSADDSIVGSGSLWDKESVKIGRFDANTRVSERLEDGDRRLLWVTYTFGDGQDSIVILGTGIYGANVAGLITNPKFSIKARRGEYYVLDKDVRVANRVLYPVPSEKGKGVIVTPQYHGNTLLGPTSEFVDFEDVFKTTAGGLEYIKVNSQKLIKDIPFHKIIRSFAGGRSTSSTEDFIIEESEVKGFINVCGIESPGLTAAPAIAVYVVEDIVANMIKLNKNINYNYIIILNNNFYKKLQVNYNVNVIVLLKIS